MSNDSTPAGSALGATDPGLFPALFASYPDGLLLVDANGTIRLANPAACTLFGYPQSQLVGLSVEALVPDGVRPHHESHRRGYALNPRTRPMGTQLELTARRRDGSEVMVEIALSPLPDSGAGQVVAAVRGIGSYPRVQQALQRARYSEAVARMGRLAVTTRDAHALLGSLPAVAARTLLADTAMVFLLSPNQLEFEVAAQHGSRLGPGHRVPNRPDTPPGYVFATRAPLVVSDTGREARFSTPRWLREGGGRSVLGVPVLDHDRVVGVLEVRAEAARQFAQAEAEFLASLANLLAASLQRTRTEEHLSHSQRMESVGQLTGGIAHDFNNLLTVIQGNLQVLGELPALNADPQASQLVGAAARASRRGAELTGKLLAFSRRQMLTPGSVDVNGLLESMLNMLRRTLDEGIRIQFEPGEPCPPCLADAGQLDSALLNIAINARDAMPAGGTLSFRARFAPVLPPALAAGLEEPGHGASGYVVISISDTGSGMPEAVRQRAFEPFFTTKELGRGTGLGLSTVYGFVKQSHGAIALDSSPGSGTTITIALPAAPAEAGAPSAGPLPDGTLPEGLRVMLVEDDLDVLEVALRFLEGLGCTVAAFTNAEEALRAIEAGEALDLLLSDVVLGSGMRGTELARRVRALRPGTPVLLASGYSSEAARRDSEDPPDLLAKPYDRDELGRAITRALRNPG